MLCSRITVSQVRADFQGNDLQTFKSRSPTYLWVSLQLGFLPFLGPLKLIVITQKFCFMAF